MLVWRPAPRRADGPISTPRRLWPRSMGTPMMRTFCAMSYPRLVVRDWTDPPFLHESGSHHSRCYILRNLRVYPVNHAREGNHFADVLRPANPGDRAFQAHSEAGMRHAAVAPQVEVPLERLFRQVVFAQALQQQIVIVDALAPADNFAIAFGRNHVEGQRQLRPLGVGLHVESLHRRRVM